MGDLMKRAVVSFTCIGGRYPDNRMVVGKIDITHVYMTEWPIEMEDTPLTEEQLCKGSIYHVGQFRGFADVTVYPAVWDWLRGIGELEGKRFHW